MIMTSQNIKHRVDKILRDKYKAILDYYVSYCVIFLVETETPDIAIYEAADTWFGHIHKLQITNSYQWH